MPTKVKVIHLFDENPDALEAKIEATLRERELRTLDAFRVKYSINPKKKTHHALVFFEIVVAA